MRGVLINYVAAGRKHKVAARKETGDFAMVLLSGRLGGCHNFTSNKNKALQSWCQITHLEGAFTGAF
jgi:hypothetical protein